RTSSAASAPSDRRSRQSARPSCRHADDGGGRSTVRGFLSKRWAMPETECPVARRQNLPRRNDPWPGPGALDRTESIAVVLARAVVVWLSFNRAAPPGALQTLSTWRRRTRDDRVVP